MQSLKSDNKKIVVLPYNINKDKPTDKINEVSGNDYKYDVEWDFYDKLKTQSTANGNKSQEFIKKAIAYIKSLDSQTSSGGGRTIRKKNKKKTRRTRRRKKKDNRKSKNAHNKRKSKKRRKSKN